MRCTFFANKRENPTPYFTLLEILKLENFFKLKIGALVHKIQYQKKDTRQNSCSIFKFVYRQLTPRVLLFFKRCILCSVRQCFHNIKYSCYQDSFVVQSWFCGWGKRLIYGQIHMFLDGSGFKS